MALRRAILLVCICTASEARAVKFRFPLDDPDGTHILTFMILHVDHDPVDHGTPDVHCLNYACEKDFPFCYDQHDGTDYILDGGFEAMDKGSLVIVAAADGEVIEVADGNYDRCHADVSSGSVTCDGHPMKSNFVKIRHDDGVVTTYHHMLNGSVLPKVGERVTCGQPLGLIGSSGMSAMPHLHFEVMLSDGSIVDPYAGPCSQAESYWVEQEGPLGLPEPRCEAEVKPDESVSDPVFEDLGGYAELELFYQQDELDAYQEDELTAYQQDELSAFDAEAAPGPVNNGSCTSSSFPVSTIGIFIFLSVIARRRIFSWMSLR